MQTMTSARKKNVQQRALVLLTVLLLLLPLCPSGASAQADATWVVSNTADSGPGSLRQAIVDANANRATPQLIQFNIPTTDPGFDGRVFTIQPQSPLPTLLGNVIIDGATQTAYTGDTNRLGPEVVINGAQMPEGPAFHISGDYNTIAGLIINGFAQGGAIGIDYRIDSTPSFNQVRNNYIGTDATGRYAVPNGGGVGIAGFATPPLQAADNVIENNLISGNIGRGLGFCDAARTQVRNNLIGVDRTGRRPLGNGEYGIALGCAGAPNNRFEENTIAYNGAGGILDEPDYRYWGSWTSDGHQGNVFRRNAIYANGGLGINLLPAPFGFFDGVTPNDAGDADTGSNTLQNFPVLTSATAGRGVTTVAGTLNSTPDRSFEIELFGNQAVDPSGHGEGQVYLGVVTVTTDAVGNAAFSAVLPRALLAGSFVTATATDAAGNTSEFSAAVAVVR